MEHGTVMFRALPCRGSVQLLFFDSGIHSLSPQAATRRLSPRHMSSDIDRIAAAIQELYTLTSTIERQFAAASPALNISEKDVDLVCTAAALTHGTHGSYHIYNAEKPPAVRIEL
jgi:hypothetical protein